MLDCWIKFVYLELFEKKLPEKMKFGAKFSFRKSINYKGLGYVVVFQATSVSETVSGALKTLEDHALKSAVIRRKRKSKITDMLKQNNTVDSSNYG